MGGRRYNAIADVAHAYMHAMDSSLLSMLPSSRPCYLPYCYRNNGKSRRYGFMDGYGGPGARKRKGGGKIEGFRM